MAKKFERKTRQDNPLSTDAKQKKDETNKVDINEKTIKEQQNKK